MLRFWLAAVMGARLGAPHLRTVFVNVSGSFAIGFLAALGPRPFTRQLFMIGLLGGYTTFSAFSLQTLELAHEGKPATAGANVGLSVFLSLLAVTRRRPLPREGAKHRDHPPLRAFWQRAWTKTKPPIKSEGALLAESAFLRWLAISRILSRCGRPRRVMIISLGPPKRTAAPLAERWCD